MMVGFDSGRGKTLALVVTGALAISACSGGAASSPPSAPASTAPASAAPASAAPSSPSSATPSDAATSQPELTAVKFLLPSPLEIKYYMPVLARDLGYFAEEGLEVSIEPTNGSSFVLQLVTT